MPQWLSIQLMKAFQKKDRRQIKLLNECWFFYRTKPLPPESAAQMEQGNAP